MKQMKRIIAVLCAFTVSASVMLPLSGNKEVSALNNQEFSYDQKATVQDFSGYNTDNIWCWGGGINSSMISALEDKVTVSYPTGEDATFSLPIATPSSDTIALSFDLDASAVSEVFCLRVLYSIDPDYISTAQNKDYYLKDENGSNKLTIGANGNMDIPAGFKGTVTIPIESFGITGSDWTHETIYQKENLRFQFKISSTLNNSCSISYDNISYLINNSYVEEGFVYDKETVAESFDNISLDNIWAWGSVSTSDMTSGSNALSVNYTSDAEASFSIPVPTPTSLTLATAFDIDTTAAGNQFYIRSLFSVDPNYAATAEGKNFYLVDSESSKKYKIEANGDIKIPAGFKGTVIIPMDSYSCFDDTAWNNDSVYTAENLRMQFRVISGLEAPTVISYDNLRYLTEESPDNDDSSDKDNTSSDDKENSENIGFVMVITLFFSLLVLPANAESYTYNYEKEAVETPEAVVVEKYLDFSNIPCGMLSSPEDMDIDNKGNIYISDTENNRIVILNQDLSFNKTITVLKGKDGKNYDIKAPNGIFCADSGEIYIACSGNNRVFVTNDGKTLLRTITASAKDVMRDTFTFTPLKVAADSSGRTFVIADGVYDGLMQFEPDGTFIGFSGSAKVTYNIIDLFWMWFGTEKQRKQRIKNIPVEFDGLDMDAEGFVYTASGSVDQWNPYKSEPIRRQTNVGTNILRFIDELGNPIGDIEYPYETDEAEVTGPSRLIDISADCSYGYCALDSKRGRIFVYNDNGDLMFAFGGLSGKQGEFVLPSAVAATEDRIYVLDKGTGAVTVFGFSDYAKLIISAQQNYFDGDYEQSKKEYEEILKLNSGLDLAYAGLGKILILEGDYSTAMEYLRFGKNKTYYSKAFGEYRSQWMSDNFLIILIIAIIFITLTVLFVKVFAPKIRAKNYSLFENETYRGSKYSLHIMTHPFDGFWDMTREKRGNLKSATLLYGVFVGLMLIRSSCSGFLFTEIGKDFDILATLMLAIIPIVLWCLCNWAVSTLFDGDGKLSTIYMSGAYCLTPYIITAVPAVLLSNFLTLEETMILYVVEGFAVLWCVFLLFAAMVTIHGYSGKKAIGIIIATIVGMAAVIFLIVLLFNIVQQMLIFLLSIYNEILIRI